MPDVELACDHGVLLKRVVKHVARAHGMAACFMAKPFSDCAGSGLHIHVSVVDREGHNVFGAADGGLSDTLRNAIGGLIETMPEGMAIFAPNANSYRRLRKGVYVPLTPNWGRNHRQMSLRIPLSGPEDARIEHRVAGADANPYLVVAAVLAGIEHGIATKSDAAAHDRGGDDRAGGHHAADALGAGAAESRARAGAAEVSRRALLPHLRRVPAHGGGAVSQRDQQPRLRVVSARRVNQLGRWGTTPGTGGMVKLFQVGLICALLVFPVPLIASTVPDDLRVNVALALKENGLTGAVWARVTSDGAIAVDAAGVKDTRTGESLSPDDRVHIGSVTKTLLAAGVLRLVSEGRLALDTPIAELLRHPVLDNPWEASDPVRLRHLLDHTSGLDDARLWQVFTLQPKADTPLAEAFAGDPALLRVRSRPGSRFSYSNMGYGLLGMVIESVTGERYERYLDVNLLRPLAMYDSTFSFVSQVGPTADRRLAMGHFENGAPQAAVPTYLRSPVQFTTTAKDMAAFGRFLMSDGRIGGDMFIDTALLRAMGQPIGTEAADAGLPAGYGLGLGRRDRHGAIGRCHEGNTVGYRAMLCLFSREQKAYFIAINSDSETADYGRFDALLIEGLDLAAEPSLLPGAPADDVASWQGIYVPAPNRFASFAWLDTVFNFVRVTWNGTHMQLTSLQHDERVLVPQGGLLFRATDRATTSHVLLTSSDGGRVLSSGFQSYERTSLARIVLLWASMCAGVLGLLFIFLGGIARLLIAHLTPSQPIFVPFLAAIGLLLPFPFFLRQSFLQLGDVTAASVTLAAVTLALPLGMLIGVLVQLRNRAVGIVAVVDLVAMLAVLQWTMVLAAWNLVPLRLWH